MIDLQKQPFYWNGSTFPTIGGFPALVTVSEYRACCCPPPEPIQINLADYFRPIRHDVPPGGFYGAAEVRGALWYASEIWSYAGSAADPDDDLVINGNVVFADNVAGRINGGVDTKLFDLPAGTPLILNVRNSTIFGGPCHSLGFIWIVPTI